MKRDEPSSRNTHQLGRKGSAGRQTCLSTLPYSAKLQGSVSLAGFSFHCDSLPGKAATSHSHSSGCSAESWQLEDVLSVPSLLLKGLLPWSLNLSQPLQWPVFGGDITEPVSRESASPSPAYQNPSITPGTRKQAIHRGRSNGQWAQGGCWKSALTRSTVRCSNSPGLTTMARF